MELKVSFNNKDYPVEVEQTGDNYRYKIGDAIFDADFQLINKNELIIHLDNKNIKAEFVRDKEKTVIYIDGERYEFKEEKEQKKRTDEETQENIIKAPMPGLIIKIGAQKGNTVKKGDILIILEAMKMQHELRSKANMVVKEVFVKEGDQVDAFATLVELSPAG